MAEFVTFQDMAQAEDKLNGKIDRSIAEQNDYRHDQTEVFNLRFVSMEEKLDKIIETMYEIKENSTKTTTILDAHMRKTEEKLSDIEKTVESKIDNKYFWGAVAVIVVIGGYFITKIEMLEDRVNNLPNMVIEQLKENYDIKN